MGTLEGFPYPPAMEPVGQSPPGSLATGEPRGAPSRPVPGTGYAGRPGPRLRVRVTKLGPAAYLGHLDYLRLVPRVCRRAGVPLFYGGGFHPKPAIAASPALGLGTASAGEIFDLRLLESAAAVPVPEILSRLDAASPAGVRFLAVRALEEGDPALGRVIGAADFAIEAGALGDSATGVSRVAALAGSDVTIVRAQKGSEKRLRVGAFVLGAFPPGPGVDLEALGLRPPAVVARLRLAADGSLRPPEVIEAALGAPPGARPRAVRLALWALTADGVVVDPLDLEAVRARSPRVGRE